MRNSKPVGPGLWKEIGNLTETKEAFIVAGKLAYDYIISEAGILSENLLGGNGIFAALGLSAYVSPVRLISRRGMDFPQEWLALLEKRGIDISSIQLLARPHDFKGVMKYRSDGSRKKVTAIDEKIADIKLQKYVNYRMSWGETLEDFYQFTYFPDPYSCRTEDILAAPGVLICSAKAVQQGEWIQRIRKINPQLNLVMDSPIEGEHGRIPENFFSILTGVDCFLPSEVEMKTLFPDLPLKTAMKMIAQKGPQGVIVKQGVKGALLYERLTDTFWQIPPFSVEGADPTGAGDSFCGGFMAGWSVAKDLKEGVIWGNAVASVTVSTSGGEELARALNTVNLEERKIAIRRAVKRW
jgi:sugar/nucleoside kinase (ribokinase family)